MFGISRATIVQFVKFNLVGGLNTLLAAIVYVIVAALTGSYTLGLISDYVFGIIFGFIANKLFTFEKKDEPVTLKLIGKYVLVYGFVFAINWSLLHVAVDTYGYDKYIAQFVIFAVIVVPLFFVQKKYVFVDKPTPAEPA